MKLTKLSAGILLATVVCGLTATTGRAQVQTQYTQGDLFIGFRATGGTGVTQNYLINIGQASQFKGLEANETITLSLENIAADLAGLYGGNWFSRSDVLWSVSGGNLSSSQTVAGDAPRTLYYSRYEGGPAWTAYNFAGQQAARSSFEGQYLRYIQEQDGDPILSTANSDFGTIQNNSTPNSYGFYQVGDNQPSAYNAFPGGGENAFGSGVAGANLDLYRLPVQASGSAPGTLLGTFSITQAGVVSFTAVPEPSVLALLGIGAVGACAYFMRRKSA